MNFFHKASKKEAGTIFVLLFKSRNMIGRLMKIYLHRQTEIPFVLTLEIFPKILTKLQNFLAFSAIHLQAELRI